MSREAVIRYCRLEIITGRHLNTAFISDAVRHDGWQRIQRARRIARRLGLDNRSLPQI